MVVGEGTHSESTSSVIMKYDFIFLKQGLGEQLFELVVQFIKNKTRQQQQQNVLEAASTWSDLSLGKKLSDS